VIKAIVYGLSSTVAAASFGLALGAMGSLLAPNVRIASATVLAGLAILLGLLDLGSRAVTVLQCDRETPQRRVHRGAIRWAMRNGAALGVGFTSRIGFWLWYVVPAGALLWGDPAFGAALFGTYGFVRGWSVWIMFLNLPIRVPDDDVGVWLLRNFGNAHRLSAGHLIAVGVAVTVAVGA
jgi:hypothetical protein